MQCRIPDLSQEIAQLVWGLKIVNKAKENVMVKKTTHSIPDFLIKVIIIHTLTYFAAGFIASNILNYRYVFTSLKYAII
ncbi:MAG: hypothetical protein L5655_01290 [Thermosediminibacteraceae bacterium]|nr:hypothetical protein [Thermosediminibacteraceae bacterium]